jgi:hypothetical protein
LGQARASAQAGRAIKPPLHSHVKLIFNLNSKVCPIAQKN